MAIAAQDVLDQALDLVEMTNSTGTSGFAVTNRIQDAFNMGLSRLHYILADGDLDWYAERASIPIVASTAQYALPDGTLYSAAPQFYKLKDLFLVESGKVYTIPKFEHAETSGWEASGPRVAGTLRMTYIPAYVPIARGNWAAVNISYPYPPGWEDFVALFVATRLAIRMQDYERASALAAERNEVLTLIMQHLGPRDTGRQNRVVDVTSRWQTPLHYYYNQNYYYRLFGDYLEIGQPAVLP